ncbi:MAG TPA: ATPase domain-containing protein [Candidatus Thermoplasmatota archaeon]
MNKELPGGKKEEEDMLHHVRAEMNGASSPSVPRRDGSTVARLSTGVMGLDDIMNGGMPRGNTVLLAGASGTGKTTLAFQFLCEGAERGEPGAFISVTEPTAMLKRNLSSYQFFKQEYLDSGKVTLLDLRAVALKMGLKDGMFQGGEYFALVSTLQKVCKELQLKRLVIDSITAVCQWLVGPVRVRDFVYRLGLALSDLNCTTLLTSETPPREIRFSMFGVEEFISDGIIFLGEEEQGRQLVRTLQVIKMRGTSHERSKYFMELTPDGIKLFDRLHWSLRA